VTAVATNLVPRDITSIDVVDGVARIQSPVLDSTHIEISHHELNSLDSTDSLNDSFNFVDIADTDDVIDEQPEILEKY